MTKRLSEQELEGLVAKVWKMVDTMPEPRRTKVRAMLEGPVGEQYFLAPASSRTEYHSAFPGGLVLHSLNVTSNLVKLTEALCPGRYERHVLYFVGLFHDLGKAGDGTQPRYVPKESDWHVRQGIMYDTNKTCRFAPTSELGLFVLQAHGIELGYDEWAAIRLNDGQYCQENKVYAMHEPDLALLVHWADRFSTSQEK